MADLVNELVWSHSRSRACEGCKRAYWYAYYGSWGGWGANAPAEARAAYVQKKLTTRAMWIGTVVHRVAEELLRDARDGRQTPTLDDVVSSVRTRCEKDVRESADGSWLQRPAKRVGFREHYYEEGASEADWAQAIDEIERQLRGLWTQRLFQRLLAVPSRIRELEDMRRFAVGDVDVWVVLDVLVDDGRGGVVILDWKTGGHHDDAEIRAQLGVYGLYATAELGIAADAIVAMHVNLRHNEETKHAVGEAEIALAKETIRDSTARMRALLVDVEQNIADPGAYPTLDPGSEDCRRCGFRGICGRR